MTDPCGDTVNDTNAVTEPDGNGTPNGTDVVTDPNSDGINGTQKCSD